MPKKTKIKTNTREQLLNLVNSTFEIKRGHPWPLGTTLVREGVNFAVISGSAKIVSLVIYSKCSTTPLIEFPLDPRINKTGDIWHAHITGLDPWISYAYRVFSDDNFRKNGIL